MPKSLLEFYDEQFQALDQVSGEPLVDMAYFLMFPDGELSLVIPDDQGKLPRVHTEKPEKIKVLSSIDAVVAQSKLEKD